MHELPSLSSQFIHFRVPISCHLGSPRVQYGAAGSFLFPVPPLYFLSVNTHQLLGEETCVFPTLQNTFKDSLCVCSFVIESTQRLLAEQRRKPSFIKI